MSPLISNTIKFKIDKKVFQSHNLLIEFNQERVPKLKRRKNNKKYRSNYRKLKNFKMNHISTKPI